ncbi:MAG: transcriptional regulator [Opitutales bacterium]|nr:transcriptional regulator [Opitutales bacterium]
MLQVEPENGRAAAGAAAADSLESVRDIFIRQWGAMGSQWGVNRSMAMIHALLLVSPEPLTTDAIMEELEISRGNANTNLRELVDWGLVYPVLVKGDRRDYFVAEKDVWRIFCIVARERKRREMEPAQKVLEECVRRSGSLEGEEAQAMHAQLARLSEFVGTANELMDKLARPERDRILPNLMRVL